VLEQITGAPVRYYRPPYGAQSVSSYLAARRAGLTVVVWSADADDWTDRPVDQVAADGLDALSAGGILLLHERLEPDPRNGAPTTTFDRADLARRVVEGVRERGWEPGTVHDLVTQGGARRSAWFRP
jgi:peptidoglycan/xylan/chitin deacetylase (PgdA/CDA1 family)